MSQYKFELRDLVKIKTDGEDDGKVGIVYRRFEGCPNSNLWLEKQLTPIKAEDVRKPWYSIMSGHGSVDCPENNIMLTNVPDSKIEAGWVDIYKKTAEYYIDDDEFLVKHMSKDKFLVKYLSKDLSKDELSYQYANKCNWKLLDKSHIIKD